MTTLAAVDSDDFYERLGVAREAPLDEIKRAYRALVRQFPPERDAERFKRIREAYETLGDPRSREEYDARPSAEVEQWFSAGLAAMNAKDYQAAEQLFKQALLLEPDIGYIRNLLGLCFLYQGEPAKALPQFERLLRQPDAPASWFANAGHAYAQMKNARNAEVAFREAIRRSTESPVEYVLALADLFIGQRELDRAARELELAIQADGVVDFQDLRCLMKLLEVHLLQRNERALEADLKRVVGLAGDEEQRRYVAWRLGILAQQLIGANAFDPAMSVAMAAQQLQPDDEDYVALDKAAFLLKYNNFRELRALLDTHPSFQADAWLERCGLGIRQYMARHRALDGMRPIAAAPGLRTVNGIGTMLYGARDRDAVTGSHVATLFFVFFFIPVAPLACYRVISRGNSSWSFLGRVPFSRWEKVHLGVAIVVGLLLLGYCGSSNGSDRGALTGSDFSTPVSEPPAYSEVGEAPAAAAPAAAPEAPSTGDPFADAARGADEAWFESERARIRSLESEIKGIDAEMERARSDIEMQQGRMRAAEGGYGTASVGDPQYESMIRSYNYDVDRYNARLQDRRARYQEYESALETFNARVDAHNARLHR